MGSMNGYARPGQLVYEETHSGSRLYEFGKRALDIGVALPFVLIFLPLLPILALVIKLASPGPVFYPAPAPCGRCRTPPARCSGRSSST